MFIVIMGCGRVGAHIANELCDLGHETSVIDIDDNAFRRLGAEYTGRTTKGIGFDKDVLRKAGIEQADAFVAVSNGDNSNIIAARVVRELFGVQNVVARIYDQQRADVYEKLGIPTVATVRWAARQVLSRLLPERNEMVWQDPTGQVGMSHLVLPDHWAGKKIAEIEEHVAVKIVYIARYNHFLMAKPEIVYQAGDQVFFACAADEFTALRDQLLDRAEEN